jgi:hypothetical protein
MTKLNHVKFNGFTMGVRVADQYVLTLTDVNTPLAIAGLHAIKGLAHKTELTSELGVIGINGAAFIGSK